MSDLCYDPEQYFMLTAFVKNSDCIEAYPMELKKEVLYSIDRSDRQTCQI